MENIVRIKNWEYYMKKIYIKSNNVADVYDVVIKINKRISEYMDYTTRIISDLKRYEMTGNQLDHASKEIKQFSIRMAEYKNEIYKVESHIYKYCEKINKYEARKIYLPKPYKFNDVVANIDVNNKIIKLELSKLKKILEEIKMYLEKGRDFMKKIRAEKNNIGSIWNDLLYNDFSKFIDYLESDFMGRTYSAFDTYCNYFALKIRELESN